MKKLFLTMMLAPVFVYANVSVGYTNVDGDLGEDGSVSISALNLAYNINMDDSPFSAQVGMAIGISDDDIDGIKLEMDPSFYLKGIYNINENVFVNVVWMNLQIEGSMDGASVTASDSEAGFGLGFRPNEKVTVNFDIIEDTNMISVHYNF